MPPRLRDGSLASMACALLLAACPGRQRPRTASVPLTEVSSGAVGLSQGAETSSWRFTDVAGRSVDMSAFRGRAVLVLAITLDDLASNITVRAVLAGVAAHPEDAAAVVLVCDPQEAAERTVFARTFQRVLGADDTPFALADASVLAGATPLGPIPAVPLTFLVNRAGVVVRRIPGPLRRADVDDILAGALGRLVTAPRP